MKERKTSLLLIGTTSVLAIGIFALDLWLPRGVAGGVLYSALVLLALWSPHRRFLLMIAASASVLTILGFFWSAGTPSWVTMTNRSVGLFIIWVTAILLLRRKRAEDELEQANLKLANGVTELTQRSHELVLLNEMGTLLQGCLTSEEAHTVITTFARQLFPANSGALGVKSPSQNFIETVREWGEPGVNKSVFPLEECWALRRAQTYAVEDPNCGLLCSHFIHPLSTGYACLPITAHSEVLGVLFLQTDVPGAGQPNAAGRLDQEATLRIAGVLAHQIALALANLRLRETLRTHSIRDPLTGLFNRRHLEEALELELHRAQRTSLPVAIIMLDLDHFKQVNDTFGHQAGDALLCEVARVLKRMCRAGDLACRFGGEEFVLLLPGTSLRVATHRAETILGAVKSLQVSHESQILSPLTVSEGVATFPEHGATSEALIQAVDTALYRAKHEGRARLVVAGPSKP